MVIIVFGVAGAGKTLIGSRLARELGWAFHDADLFHSAANIEKMRRGLPLTDEDRRPWLESVCQALQSAARHGEGVVLACSALKATYRDRLLACTEAKLVFLKGEYSLIAERLQERHGHFFDPHLLRNQFETLEEPQDGALVVDVALSPADIVEEIRTRLEV